MSAASPALEPRRWKKPPFIRRAWLRWMLGVGAALYLALALGTTEVNWTRGPIFFDLAICAGGKLFAGGMQPPIPFSPSYILLEISGFTGPPQEIRFL